MSINTLPSNSILNQRRLTPEPFVPQGDDVAIPTWTRPADWTPLATLTSSLIFSGIVAVNDSSMEYVALTITGTGVLTVDWGDGTSETLTTGIAKTHQFSYAGIPDPVTSFGYKTALVNISVVGGSISVVNLQVNPVANAPNTQIGGTNSWGPKWLDFIVGSGSLAALTLGIANKGGQLMSFPLLEQVVITQTTSGFSPTNLFGWCWSLQSVSINTSNWTGTKSAASMFTNCYKLAAMPTINYSFSSVANMFDSCYKLQYVPDSFTNGYISSATTAIGMFSSCYSLRTAPKLYIPNATTINGIFVNCQNLETVPTITTGTALTNMTNAFFGCVSLVNAPMITNTTNVTQANTMFQGCKALRSIPLYNFQSLSSATTMFTGCVSLETLPGPINFTSMPSLSGMFSGCTSLEAAPLLLTDLTLTDTSSMFSGCTNLTSVPLFDTSGVTTMASMFVNCSALVSVPLFVTSNVTNMANMFNGCNNLKVVPQIDTIKVSNALSMFQNCSSLQTLPSLNTSNVTTTQSMFQSCTGLISVGAMDLTKVTTMASTFNGCTSLENVSNVSNTGNVISFSATFSSCPSLEEAPLFDTSKATNISTMFQLCSGLVTIPTYNTINVTTNTSFVSGCAGLTSVPALNFSNVTTGGSIGNCVIATTYLPTGMKVSHSLGTMEFGSIELTNYMANLGSNTTVQTFTVTGLSGADTANVKTGSGITAGSNVITMANTVGIFAGSSFLYGTGVNTGIPVTFGLGTTYTVVYTNGGGLNGLADGDNVMFTSITGVGGLSTNTRYFVVNRTSTTFQLSLTAGGSVVTFSNGGSGTGVMSIGGATISNQVLTVNANANVIISGVCGITNAAASVTARRLNQNYATTKNWNITG